MKGQTARFGQTNNTAPNSDGVGEFRVEGISSEVGDLIKHRLEVDTVWAVRRPLEDEAPRDIKIHEHDLGLSTLEHETAAAVLLPVQAHPEEAGRDGEEPLGRFVREGEAIIQSYVRLIHDESELTVPPFWDRNFASEVEGNPVLQAQEVDLMGRALIVE